MKFKLLVNDIVINIIKEYITKNVEEKESKFFIFNLYISNLQNQSWKIDYMSQICNYFNKYINNQ